MLPTNVILIGFMGSGKTSVGQELARRLEFSFLDTDHLIEKAMGQEIFRIFENYGEAFFREREKKILSSLKGRENCVMATGGGMWTREGNRSELLKMGWCVWLKVSAEDSWKRVSSNLSQRPLLNKALNPFEFLKKTIAEREHLYSLANYSIDTRGKNLSVIAQEITQALKIIKPFDPKRIKNEKN